MSSVDRFYENYNELKNKVRELNKNKKIDTTEFSFILSKLEMMSSFFNNLVIKVDKLEKPKNNS